MANAWPTNGAGEAYLPLLEEALGRLCRGPAGASLIALLRQEDLQVSRLSQTYAPLLCLRTPLLYTHDRGELPLFLHNIFTHGPQ
jgi:hypothetical protein